MFGFSAKLPVTEEDRLWVDEGFARLEKLLGRERMLSAKVVLPIAEDFPDHYDKSPTGAERLFCRVCSFMQVDRERIQLEMFPDETENFRALLPEWNESTSKSAAGMYFRGDESDSKDNLHASVCVIALKSSQLKDPLALVATMAHELGHVILLEDGLLPEDTADHEPLTDLLTVFLGMGIFTGNSAARFMQYQDGRRYGWSMQKLGYLPEQVFGYALARFAMERGEKNIEWERYLSTNVRAYFKSSRAWLLKGN